MASSSTTPPNDAKGSRSISLHGWTITSVVLPILNGPESDRAAAALGHLPLPEICFGNNRLTVENKALGIKLEWDALSALKSVELESGVKVAHAAVWARGQAASSSSDVTVLKPFDWTYTTLHPGTTTTSSSFQPAPPTHPGIPLHLLARQDIPILFFAEIPLFEDELGDNGISELVVRVRVNSTSFFVLSRFFLRVDGVLIRLFDVRLYHSFGSNEIIREIKGRQSNYFAVKRKLPLDKPEDLKPLTDVNWVSGVLELLAVSASGGQDRREDADSLPSWRGEGRRLEVLTLS